MCESQMVQVRAVMCENKSLLTVKKMCFLFVYVMYCLCVSYDDLFVIRIECVVGLENS